jgi:hypothetical protein
MMFFLEMGRTGISRDHGLALRVGKLLIVADDFELVAQGHTAKTKLNRRHVAAGPAASLGPIGGRRRGSAGKDAVGC